MSLGSATDCIGSIEEYDRTSGYTWSITALILVCRSKIYNFDDTLRLSSMNWIVSAPTCVLVNMDDRRSKSSQSARVGISVNRENFFFLAIVVFEVNANVLQVIRKDGSI